MSVHEQFADDLALYAIGTLQGQERAAMEAHLKSCADCRAELERLRGDAALLAFSVSGPRPPARSKARLMAAVASEPRRSEVRELKPVRSSWRTWFSAFEWAGAVAVVVMVLLLVRQNGELNRQLAEARSGSAAQQEQLQRAKEFVASLTSPDAVRYTLVAAKTPPQPQGRAIYVAKSGTLVFLASNMPALPPQKTYELWLIPTSGAPIPAGLFRPNPQGSAAVVKPQLPVGVEAKTFAITVEPEAGSPSPTTQPIMVGTQG